jgi:hypothetical protein
VSAKQALKKIDRPKEKAATKKRPPKDALPMATLPD